MPSRSRQLTLDIFPPGPLFAHVAWPRPSSAVPSNEKDAGQLSLDVGDARPAVNDVASATLRVRAPNVQAGPAAMAPAVRTATGRRRTRHLFQQVFGLLRASIRDEDASDRHLVLAAVQLVKQVGSMRLFQPPAEHLNGSCQRTRVPGVDGDKREVFR